MMMCMKEDPSVMESLPEQPLTDAHIKEIGESDSVVGAMPFPDEDGVRGFVIEQESSFTAVVFDPRTDTWRKLQEYDKDEFSLQDAFSSAVSDRSEWFADTGRLDEL